MKFVITVDMQNDFVTGSLANKDAQKIVQPLAEYLRKAEAEGYKLIFTQDTHSEDYLNTPEGKKLPVPHCVKDTEGWKIVPGLAEFSGERVEKPVFGYSGWENFFKRTYNAGADEVNEIVLTGVCTDICVVSNALLLKSVFPAADIKVIGNLCAGLTPEKHRAALDVMSSCQIDII